MEGEGQKMGAILWNNRLNGGYLTKKEGLSYGRLAKSGLCYGGLGRKEGLPYGQVVRKRGFLMEASSIMGGYLMEIGLKNNPKMPIIPGYPMYLSPPPGSQHS